MPSCACPPLRCAACSSPAAPPSVRTVRGTVMNPVDHPHGGGEGKNHTSGRPSVSPWGKPAKGKKTRDPKKGTNRLIIRRRKTK